VGHRVAADGHGNPHVIGILQNTRQFGDVTITNDHPTHNNLFIAKYGADGDFQWVRQFHNGDFDFSNIVDLEQKGVSLPRTFLATKADGVPPPSRTEIAAAMKLALSSLSPSSASNADM